MLHCQSIQSPRRLKAVWNHHIESIPPSSFLSTQMRLKSVILTFSQVHIYSWFLISKGWILELFWKRTNNLVQLIEYTTHSLSPNFVNLFRWHINDVLNVLMSVIPNDPSLEKKDTPLPGSERGEGPSKRGLAKQEILTSHSVLKNPNMVSYIFLQLEWRI